jgi:hypothetical protein
MKRRGLKSFVARGECFLLLNEVYRLVRTTLTCSHACLGVFQGPRTVSKTIMNTSTTGHLYHEDFLDGSPNGGDLGSDALHREDPNWRGSIRKSLTRMIRI